MRPAPFRYFAPRSSDAVKELLAEYGEDARLLAGGQSLVPLMNLRLARPSVLIDLNRVEGLATIAARQGELVMGPMVRQRDAEQSAAVEAASPLVARALSYAGPLAVRQRATVGGTLAHADRTAELPGVAAALDATLIIDGPTGRRQVKANDFFRGDLTTAIGPAELLVETRFPARRPGDVVGFFEAGIRRRDMALAGVAACLDLSDGRCREARIAVIGVSSTPLRLTAVETVVVAEGPTSPKVREAAVEATAKVEMVSDVHATAELRRQLVVALIGKAMAAARSPQ
jgi:carbon-monoxide dehydrogenase medium subunit